MSVLRILVCVIALLNLFQNVIPTKNSAVLLAKAGQDLAFKPLMNRPVETNNPDFVEPARFDDLATTRLQVKTNDVIDKIWENINEPRRFVIIKEKGAAKEVLKLFGLLQNDIYSLGSQITRSEVNT